MSAQTDERQMTWGPGPATIAPPQAPRKISTGRLVLAALAAIVVLGGIVTAFAMTSTKNDASTSGGARIVEDNGLGIGYGIKVDSDWGCTVSGPATFACVGSSRLASITSGSRSQLDIAAQVADVDIAVRYDATRWRCDAGLTVLHDGRRGFTCDQRS